MRKFLTAECRVGVVGPSNSGKTVLLTSLINHLREHEPARFQVGKPKTRVRKFRELPAGRGWGRFRYERHRDDLVRDGRWPEKTTDRCRFVCEFERTDWRLARARLTLYDLPGERVADAFMYAAGYARWSDHVVGLMEDDGGRSDCFVDFLSALRRPDAPAEELLAAYRVGLARQVLRFRSHVSPSLFLLDSRGGQLRDRVPGGAALPAEVIAAERHAELGKSAGPDPLGDPSPGLNPDPGPDPQFVNYQFVPLPRWARAARPELTRLFAGRYAAYRRRVVRPWVRALRSCHALVVLVDVLAILEAGHWAYDDARQGLRDLLAALRPGQTLPGRVVRGAAGLVLPAGWKPGRITRVALVAPKLDVVHDVERPKMIDLVRHLAEAPAGDHNGLLPWYTNCSAAVSAKSVPANGDTLYVCYPRDQVSRQKFRTPRLPSEWPREWRPGDYAFPRVRPAVPPVKSCPPDQVNLDWILDFVMGVWGPNDDH